MINVYNPHGDLIQRRPISYMTLVALPAQGDEVKIGDTVYRVFQRRFVYKDDALGELVAVQLDLEGFAEEPPVDVPPEASPEEPTITDDAPQGALF